MPRTQTAAPRKPSPGAEHKLLQLLVGNWNLEGRQYETEVGPAAEIRGTEQYEWLAGGFFLVHHFDARVGGDQAGCIEITGYDPSTGTYPTHTYYNNGQSADWQLRLEDETWTLTGLWPMGGARVQVRCTIEFGDEGNTRTGKWESSHDGSRWETFWDVKATRGRIGVRHGKRSTDRSVPDREVHGKAPGSVMMVAFELKKKLDIARLQQAYAA